MLFLSGPIPGPVVVDFFILESHRLESTGHQPVTALFIENFLIGIFVHATIYLDDQRLLQADEINNKGAYYKLASDLILSKLLSFERLL
jgi:hypothetical protein